MGISEKFWEEICKVCKFIDKFFGVNFVIVRYDGNYKDLFEVVIEEKVLVIFVMGGNF